MLLRILGALLVIWVGFMVLGFLIKTAFWLALIGGAAALVTAGIGYAKRRQSLTR